jgi:heme oxygenase
MRSSRYDQNIRHYADMLLERLKSETQDHHQRMESAIDPLRAGFSLEDYTRLLRRFLGFYRPLEVLLRAGAPDLLEGRRKVPALIADLEYLGIDATAVADCEQLPLLDTRWRIVGAMYVTEGASLGGQILCRHFAEQFGLGPGCGEANGRIQSRGSAFFWGYGRRTAAMWKQFGVTVNGVPQDSWEEAIQGSIDTFERMYAWIGEKTAEPTPA